MTSQTTTIFLGAILVAVAAPAPAFAQDACAEVEQLVSANNASAPFMVDSVTRAETATADCANQAAAFSWTVLANGADLQDNWGTLLAAKFRNGVCAQPTLTSVIQAGWEISGTWTTQDGQTYSTVAAC